MSERVYLDADEWYPVYSLDTDERGYRSAADVPDGFTARYEAALVEWRACQDFLENAWEAARIARGHLREDEKLALAKAEKTDAEIDAWIAAHPQHGRDPVERRASLIAQRDYARREMDRLGIEV